MNSAILLTCLILLLLTGCKVGPNYVIPEIPMPEAFNEDRSGQTGYFEDENLAEWWKIFNDPFLNELISEALGGSFDYKIALSRIQQARSLYWAQFTQILPEFVGDATGTRFRTSQSFANRNPVNNPAAIAISPIQDFFQLGLDAIWEIDLFGKQRRSAQAAYDDWQATIEEARGVKISVVSEVASIYASICAYQQKSEIYSQIIQIDKELLSLSKNRFEAGLTNAQEFENIIANLKQDEAALTVLQTALRSKIYSLGILLGRMPESILPEFELARSIPFSANQVPGGLPGTLLRRRPDIAAAERQLASATEQIGIAVADLFPQVSLTGSSSSFAANPLQGSNVGFSADKFSKLLTSPSRIWGYGLFITFPLFDFGKRIATVHAQESVEQQAYLNYQKTVISALEEVEQALISYFNQEAQQEDLVLEVQANERILEYNSQLFQAGLADYIQELQTKKIWLLSLNVLMDSQLSLTTDLIAVYKAMGGDW